MLRIQSKLSPAKILIRISLIVLGLYLLICTALYFLQDRLIFSLAYDASFKCADLSGVAYDIEPLELTMNDNTVLRGWQVNPTKKNLIIYFGANAEDISALPESMVQLSDWSTVLINYRGYGDSEGVPAYKMLYYDSQEIYDYFVSSSRSAYDNVVIMGRSIGSSVATYLASTRECSAAILISPFDTLSHVVHSKCSILPTGVLLKQKFDTVTYAPEVTSHVYILAGTDDWLVPPALTKELMSYFSGETTYLEIADVGHNTIDDCDEYWPLISECLAQVDR